MGMSRSNPRHHRTFSVIFPIYRVLPLSPFFLSSLLPSSGLCFSCFSCSLSSLIFIQTNGFGYRHCTIQAVSFYTALCECCCLAFTLDFTCIQLFFSLAMSLLIQDQLRALRNPDTGIAHDWQPYQRRSPRYVTCLFAFAWVTGTWVPSPLKFDVLCLPD
jgi:hypothetical protein